MKKYFEVIIVIILLFYGCGKDKPPTGGPKDIIPPTVIDVEPTNLGINFSDTQFEFTFSEPVDLNSFKNALIIYPPIMEKKFSWFPRKISVRIEESLATNQTYYLTLTSKCKDLQNNPLEESFYTIFCTGDSIPTNEIIGTINFGSRIPEYEGDIQLDLYSGTDTLLITTRNLTRQKNFEIKHLYEQPYIINIYKDKNGNSDYDRKTEIFAREVIELESPKQNVILTLTLQDSTKPKLTNIIPKSQQLIIAKFSEDLFNIGKISISKKISEPDSIKFDENEKNLIILDSFQKENTLEIITEIPDSIEYLFSIENFSDYTENVTKYDTLSFANITLPDTSCLNISNLSIEDGTTIDSLNPEFFIEFSKIISQKEVKVSLINKENNVAQKIEISRIDAKNYKISPLNNLKNYVPYRLIISKECLDYFGNGLKEDVIVNFLPVSYE